MFRSMPAPCSKAVQARAHTPARLAGADVQLARMLLGVGNKLLHRGEAVLVTADNKIAGLGVAAGDSGEVGAVDVGNVLRLQQGEVGGVAEYGVAVGVGSLELQQADGGAAAGWLLMVTVQPSFCSTMLAT